MSAVKSSLLRAVEAPSLNPLDDTINSALQWLADHQHAEGFWLGMLESNSCMEAEWVLAMYVLGVDNDPKYAGVLKSILNAQTADGSWVVYYDAPMGDINATVECYAALRVAGLHPDSEPLRKARQWILDHGGLKHIRVFTRFWLALIGEWPWENTPNIPPEIIYLPTWAPFNIYKFSSWARATLLPIAILCDRRPVKSLPKEQRLDELFPNGRDKFDFSLPRKGGLFSWERFFLVADKLLNTYVKVPVKPWREQAIRQCLEWIIRHQEADGAWGGIQPPWIYSLMALHVEGYALSHPVVAKGIDAFNHHWSYERDGGIHLQACESPVWDTLLSMLAALDCGENPQTFPPLRSAMEWILKEQVRVGGDWQVKVTEVEPGGWACERAHDFYPDVDETGVAMVVLARLRRLLGKRDLQRVDQALELAINWCEGMQCSNGGWGAFDKDNNSALVTKIPFSDFGEALDPPSVDVTAHVIEALGLLGRDLNDPVVARGVAYIKSEQESEGSWFGRWGVNHIYGTMAVLPALKAVGEDPNSAYIRKAGDWIAAHQNADGGWGESCGSYMDDSLRGRGDSTPSQTGWAMMALLSIDTHDYDDAIRRGVEFLIARHTDNTWEEPQYTGTGFPGYGLGERQDLKKVGQDLDQGRELARGFMINYNLYRHYFPLMALGRARAHLPEY